TVERQPASRFGDQSGGIMRLSHKDYDALLKTVFELHEHRELEVFRKAIPGFLLGLIPGEMACLLRYVVDERTGKAGIDDFVPSDDRFTPEAKAAFEENVMDHPIVEYYVKGGIFPALKSTDFLSRSQLRNSKFWGAHNLVKLDEALYLKVQSRLGFAS